MKQVIVVRKDLKMRRGKEIAQGAHASLAATLRNQNDFRVVKWLSESFTKIALVVDSEEELVEIYNNAKQAGLIAEKIVDNGATEFNGVKTLTCIAIGPDEPDKIDEICGHLKLR